MTDLNKKIISGLLITMLITVNTVKVFARPDDSGDNNGDNTQTSDQSDQTDDNATQSQVNQVSNQVQTIQNDINDLQTQVQDLQNSLNDTIDYLNNPMRLSTNTRSDSINNYYLLDSIYSTGLQYINTQIIPTSSTSIKMKCDLSNIIGRNNDYTGSLFGSRTSSSSNKFYLFYGGIGTGNQENKFSWNFGNQYSPYTSMNNYKTDNVIISNNGSQCHIENDNYSMTLTANANTFTGVQPMTIFGLNNNGVVDGVIGYKLYYFDVLNGQDEYHFIPAKNISTGEVGLYETVNNQFYGNAGTGVFIAGNIIVDPTPPTPEGTITEEQGDLMICLIALTLLISICKGGVLS